SIFPIGAMIGPAFGGLFVAYWSWRGVFFVNVPIGLVIVWLALRCIPRDRPREQGAAFAIDVTDMLLLGGGLLAGMLAVSALGECGGHRVSTTFAVLAALAVIALWRFVH